MAPTPTKQQNPNRHRLLLLKISMAAMYVLFVALIALGVMLADNTLAFAGLMCFTAAAALTTVYTVLTQP